MASLHRRPRSKYWHAAWRDVTGKLHMRSTKEPNRNKAWEIARGWEHIERNATNEAQVRKVLSEILQRNTGQPLRTPSVRDWCDGWLQSKSDETRKRYAITVKSFCGYLGDRAERPLKDVTPMDVQGYVDGLKRTKASGKTIALHLQALKSAFNFARKMLVIDTSPAEPVTVIVEDEIARELFTSEEAQRLINAADGEWKTLLRLGYYTGLRLMTAATLRKDAIKMKGPDGRPVIEVPKPGKRGKLAVIPIHNGLLPHLKNALTSTSDQEEFVMPTLAGADSGGKRGLSHAFREIALKAGVDMREVTRPNGHKFCKKTFHSLRHGVVSGMANKGVPKEQRMDITGHKTETQHGRYTHLQTKTLRVAINKLSPLPEKKRRR